MTEETVARHKNARNDLTAEYVRSILDYDPETGALTWKVRPSLRKTWNTRFAGKPAGILDKYGSRYYIGIDGVRYMAHRIVWLHFHGEWPLELIDHADGDAKNNKISNLRQCSRSQNNSNKRPLNGEVGLKGVKIDKRTGMYYANIRSCGVEIFLGSFNSKYDAHNAYCVASKELHGEFSRTE